MGRILGHFETEKTDNEAFYFVFLVDVTSKSIPRRLITSSWRGKGKKKDPT